MGQVDPYFGFRVTLVSIKDPPDFTDSIGITDPLVVGLVGHVRSVELVRTFGFLIQH